MKWSTYAESPTGTTIINTGSQTAVIGDFTDFNNGAFFYAAGLSQIGMRNFSGGAGSSLVVNNDGSAALQSPDSSMFVGIGGMTAVAGGTTVLLMNASGASYNQDFSSTYTKHSLVDKSYVTGITSTIVGGGGAVSGVTNGLTLTSGVLSLGGSLTKATTIAGGNFITQYTSTFAGTPIVYSRTFTVGGTLGGFNIGLAGTIAGGDTVNNSGGFGNKLNFTPDATTRSFSSYYASPLIKDNTFALTAYINGGVSLNPTYQQTTGSFAQVYGVDYNPTITGTAPASHIAFRNTSGKLLFGGTTITSGSTLADFQSTTLGVLMPRVTNIASVTTPTKAMIAYDATTDLFNFRQASNWLTLIGTAFNGLTKTGSTVFLGGTLTKSTSIQQGANPFTLINTGTSAQFNLTKTNSIGGINSNYAMALAGTIAGGTGTNNGGIANNLGFTPDSATRNFSSFIVNPTLKDNLLTLTSPISLFSVHPTITSTGSFGGGVYGFDYSPTVTGTLPSHIAWRNTSGSLLFGGSTITSGSVLADFQSASLGVVMPRVTSIASVTSPTTAMIAYDAATDLFNLRQGSNWLTVVPTINGKTLFPASTTTTASLNIGSGTAPTTPTDGDIWYDGTNLKMKIGGVIKTFTLV